MDTPPPAGPEQYYGAGEKIDRGGAGKHALHHRLQQISKNPAARKLS